MRVRIGLVGAGRIGPTLARHMAEDVDELELVAIADTQESRASALAECYGVSRVDARVADLLGLREVDAVVIATPTHSHVGLIQQAAAAGKHVFCEKPLALTVEGCDEAIAAAQAAGVKLQVGFMRRFDPAHLAAREAIEAGDIGRPVMIKCVSRDPHRTSLEFARRENSGGLILDLAIHDFDAARWLMGGEIERVHALGACLAFPELEGVGDIDNAVISLKFTDGRLGSVDVSRNAVYGKDVRTEVLGTLGSIWIDEQGYEPVVRLRDRDGAHEIFRGPVSEERFSAAFVAELEAFAGWVAEEQAPLITALDARMATQVGVAATRSLDTGKAVSLM